MALGAAVSMTAVLLVFQYGQPRIFFAMARDGLLPQWAARVHPTHAHPVRDDAAHGRRRGDRVAVGDAAETYDLTNIGTLFAFALVCIGVLVLRVNGAGPAAAVPGAVRVAGRAARRGRLRLHHGRACRARPGSGSAIWLAHRPGDLLRLRLSAQPAARAPGQRRLTESRPSAAVHGAL